MSHVNALYHIVFATHKRIQMIPNEHCEDVYRFIWKIITDSKSTLLRIGGIENHIHILLNLHPSVALANLMRDIKAKSSGWMRQDSRFPYFTGWGREYFAATISYRDRFKVIDYIKNQRDHHSIRDFLEEISALMQDEGMELTRYDWSD